ncbi:regulator of chromosome condensation, RCC1 [Pelomyxa schiedti]|nr:regulator of chromosome condensation, RCC1 [Pelomyxa schiedti]
MWHKKPKGDVQALAALKKISPDRAMTDMRVLTGTAKPAVPPLPNCPKDVYIFGGQTMCASGTYRRLLEAQGKNIVQVSAKGSRILAVLTVDGEVFVGQIAKPLVQAAVPERAVQIACAMDTLAVVGESGMLYTGTVKSSGSCALSTVENLPPVKQVLLCSCISVIVALSTKGVLFSWGQNTAGLLGTGVCPLGETAPTPHPIKVPGTVIAFDCGETHVTALNDAREVFVWGDNTSSLIAPTSQTTLETPFQLPLQLRNICSLSCGAQITFAITDDGQLWAWGSGNYKLLTGDSMDNKMMPIQLALPPVQSVSCGANHVIALTKTWDVYTWGRNDHDKLGYTAVPGKIPEVNGTPTMVNCVGRAVLQTAAGSGFTALLSERYLFGEHLTDVMLRSENRGLPAPRLIVDIVNILYKGAETESELLRLAGTKTQVMAIMAIVDRGQPYDFSTVEDLNNLVDLLKQYLNNLPDPVIPYEEYPKILALGERNAPVVEYKQFIAQLRPETHKNFLLFLIAFLNRVLKTSLMNSKNIAVCFRGMMRVKPEEQLKPSDCPEDPSALLFKESQKMNSESTALSVLIENGATGLGFPDPFNLTAQKKPKTKRVKARTAELTPAEQQACTMWGKGTSMTKTQFRDLLQDLCRDQSIPPPDDADIEEGLQTIDLADPSRVTFKEFQQFWKWYTSTRK